MGGYSSKLGDGRFWGNGYVDGYCKICCKIVEVMVMYLEIIILLVGRWLVW